MGKPSLLIDCLTQARIGISLNTQAQLLNHIGSKIQEPSKYLENTKTAFPIAANKTSWTSATISLLGCSEE
jgi:hypothetical protein